MIKYCLHVYVALNLTMTSAKKKPDKPNSELTTMQIFSKALTSGSRWCDKVNSVHLGVGLAYSQSRKRGH